MAGMGAEMVARGAVFLAMAALAGLAPCATAHAAPSNGDVVVDSGDFRLVIGSDACAKSLVVKATGEECIEGGCKKPFLSVTQDRPFDNELKLIHPNKRIVYPATSVRRDGDALVFGFAHGMYEARVSV